MSLRFEAVSPELVSALRVLMEDAVLSNFHLGGGTSLALRLGHRRSVDIDLFSDEAFDAPLVSERFKEAHGMHEVETAANTVRGVLGGVRVDVLAHRYPLLGEVDRIDGIRLLSFEDIAAMKLNAIVNRGSKKDFWDLAELLDRFSPDEIFELYAAKYRKENLWIAERSILYFDEAESQPDPGDLRGRSWEKVKSIIRAKIRL